MELKEFVKLVISDITNAVKECQEEIDNGAIICPTSDSITGFRIEDNTKAVISNIEFELSVSETSLNESSNGIGVTSFIVGKLNNGHKNENENLSKIKFSIPVVLPKSKSKETISPTKKLHGFR